jgi:hypothetical protein
MVDRRVCGIFHPAGFFFWLSGGSASSNDFFINYNTLIAAKLLLPGGHQTPPTISGELRVLRLGGDDSRPSRSAAPCRVQPSAYGLCITTAWQVQAHWVIRICCVCYFLESSPVTASSCRSPRGYALLSACKNICPKQPKNVKSFQADHRD